MFGTFFFTHIKILFFLPWTVTALAFKNRKPTLQLFEDEKNNIWLCSSGNSPSFQFFFLIFAIHRGAFDRSFFLVYTIELPKFKIMLNFISLVFYSPFPIYMKRSSGQTLNLYLVEIAYFKPVFINLLVLSTVLEVYKRKCTIFSCL